MDFRKDGELVDGIVVDDMGEKTVGNDLDNAWIQFNNVELPKSSMLSKYAEISEDGEYVLRSKVRGGGARPGELGEQGEQGEQGGQGDQNDSSSAKSW